MRGRRSHSSSSGSVRAPKLQAIVERDRTGPALEEYAERLYGQAILAAGGQFPDPAAFSGRIADLLVRVV